MFQSLARKATATARPVKISGVARLSVSSSANFDPAAPFTIRPSVAKGFAPARSARSEAMSTVSARAAAGRPNRRAGEGLATGSSRIGASPRVFALEAVPGHPAAKSGGRHRATRKCGREATLVDDVDHVRQRHHLVEVFRDEQYRRAGVPRGDQAVLDEGHGPDVEPPHRLVGEDDPRPGFQRAAEDQLLHVSPREEADAGGRAGAAYIVGFD